MFASAALLLGMASCNKESDIKQTTTLYVDTYSLVTNTTGGNPSVSKNRYNFVFDQVAGTAVMSVENLLYNLPIKTKSVKYGSFFSTVMGKDEMQSCSLMEAADATEVPQTPVTDLHADITSVANPNNRSLLNKLDKVLAVNPLKYPGTQRASLYADIQFRSGNYLVRTFWPDMLYTGSTSTQYPGADEPYSTDNIVYRVSMNLEKAGEYTADVYFYNAKFAPSDKAPSVNFVLKGLKLEFSDLGFKISGKDVDPEMIPEKTPNSKYRFDEIMIMSSVDMMRIESCRYKVATVFSGNFSGTGVYALNGSMLQ